MPKVILILGKGGREHALYWACKKSPSNPIVIVAPGNGGIWHEDRRAVNLNDMNAMVALALELKADLVVPGSETLLAAGIYEAMTKVGIKVFGPSKAAAQLETSKWFGWNVSKASGVPLPDWCERAQLYADARLIIGNRGDVMAVKADGLAAGKGAKLVRNRHDAERFAFELFRTNDIYPGEPRSKSVLLQAEVPGPEWSMFAFCDGENVRVIRKAVRDHKQVRNEPGAPNTGGMGAFAPVPGADDTFIDYVTERFFKPVVTTMRERGTPYHGTLFAGLKGSTAEPKLIEWNCRFGDPECQVLMTLLQTDIVELMFASATPGGLASFGPIETSNDASVCVVGCAEGYPGKVVNGTPVTVLPPDNEGKGRFLFHAGTEWKNGVLTADGGRVINAVGKASKLEIARRLAYNALENVSFPGMHYRDDIASI